MHLSSTRSKQPIVRSSDRQVVGYETLVRDNDVEKLSCTARRYRKGTATNARVVTWLLTRSPAPAQLRCSRFTVFRSTRSFRHVPTLE